MDSIETRDNQLNELDSQASLSHAPSAVDEVDVADSDSLLVGNVLASNEWDITDNDNTDNEMKRLTNTNIVISDKVTDNVVCNISDRDRVSGNSCSDKSSDKNIGNCMYKTSSVTPDNIVGVLEVGQNPDVDMDRLSVKWRPQMIHLGPTAWIVLLWVCPLSE